MDHLSNPIIVHSDGHSGAVFISLQVETELRQAQADYDAQLEKVRKALQKIVETHVNHMGYLKTFMVAQREYFAECQAHLGDLEGDPIR